MWQEYHSSPTHPWALSTPKWFNTEIKREERGREEGAVKRQRLTSCFVASPSFAFEREQLIPGSLRPDAVLSGSKPEVSREVNCPGDRAAHKRLHHHSYLNSCVVMYVTPLHFYQFLLWLLSPRPATVCDIGWGCSAGYLVSLSSVERCTSVGL